MSNGRILNPNDAQRTARAGRQLMAQAKASRDQTNKAFADLAEGLKTAENTLEAISTPVGKFLSAHCGFKTGDSLPMWDDLYEALCRSLPQNGYVPEQEKPENA